MSTTIKRIALVAVAALGLGVVAVAPSQATTTLDSLSALTVSSSAINAGETATAAFKLTYIASAATDSVSVKASLSGYPAGGSSGITLELRTVDSSTGTVITNNVSNSVNVNAAGGAGAVFANFTLNAVASKSAKTGTYSAIIYTAAGPAGTVVATPQTFTFTVKAISTLSDSSSTAFITKNASLTGTPVIADTAITASKAVVASERAAAVIQLNIKNATASAVEDVQVYVTGPGYVDVTNVGDTLTTRTTAAVRAGTVSIASANATQYISVFSDGTAGVSTITLVGATSGLVIGTKTLTFSDTKPASVSAVVKKAYIAAGLTTTKVFAVTVKDAAGNAITGTSATITGTRTDTTTAGKALASAALSCSWDATDLVYYCSATGASALVFGKAEYSIKATGTDADATEVTTTAATTYSDIVATKVTITGPATAEVGSKVTYTLTATDKNGYPVADTTYEGGSANGSVGGIFWNTTTVPDYTNSSVKPFNAGETITTVSGVATKSIYMPVAAGVITNTWTLAGKSTAPVGAIDKSIAGTTVAVSTTVVNPGVDAATDAANEAAQAASDATDAALAAADAADAATTAVAALSAQVNKLVAALKAQITTLTNLVLKIQKKVRA